MCDDFAIELGEGAGGGGVNLPVKFSVSAEVPAPQQEMLGARS